MTHSHGWVADYGRTIGAPVEIIPGDAGAAFLLGMQSPQSSNDPHRTPKKYLLKTSPYTHSWRGDDGTIFGNLVLTPIG